MQAAIAQSLRFNQTHRIEIDEPVLFGFRDGGRGTSFDEDGRALTPYREIMLVASPDIDTVLADTVAAATRLLDGLSDYEAIDALSDLVAESMEIFDVEENVRRLAACDGSGELAGQVITLGQMIGAGTGVCRHRSLLFKILADQLGLRASLVGGNYMSPDGEGGHAWNEIVTREGEKLVVDVMHRVVSEPTDRYFASYCSVDGTPLYVDAAPLPEILARQAADTDDDMRLLRDQPWFAVSSPFGGNSAYLFTDNLAEGERAQVEKALASKGIRFDGYFTSLGGDGDQKREVIRVRGLARLLLERLGVEPASPGAPADVATADQPAS